MANTHNHETKGLFLRVLQHFAGKPSGVSERAITFQFQSHHNRSPHTIKQWLAEQTGLIRRSNGRLIIAPDAKFVTKDATRRQTKNASPTIRQGTRRKGKGAGYAARNQERLG